MLAARHCRVGGFLLRNATRLPVTTHLAAAGPQLLTTAGAGAMVTQSFAPSRMPVRSVASHASTAAGEAFASSAAGPKRLLVASSFHGSSISLPKLVKAAQSVPWRSEEAPQLVSRDKEWVIFRLASTGTYVSVSRRGAVVVTHPAGSDSTAETAAVEALLKSDGVLLSHQQPAGSAGAADGHVGDSTAARATPVDVGQPPRETLSVVLLPPESAEEQLATAGPQVIRMTAAAATAAAGGSAAASGAGHGAASSSAHADGSGAGAGGAPAGAAYSMASQPPLPYAFIDHRGALVVRSAQLELDALRVINAAAAATVTMMAWEATVAARFAELPAKLFAALEKAGGSERSWVASMLRGLRAGSASPELEPARLYRALSEVSAITNALELGLRTINRPGSAAWNDARYAELFECLEDEFEMGERSADLTRSLAQISEAIKYALDVRKDSKSLALERIIVVLIAVEIVISLAHHAAA